MARFPLGALVLRRLALGALTLAVVAFLIFAAVSLLPGDVATEMLGQAATPETAAAFRKGLGLDAPFLLRFANWLWGVLHLRFGTSLANGRDVGALVAPRLANTVFLASCAAILSIPVAFSGGIVTAMFRNTAFDRTINVVTLASVSLPEFFVAYVLILLLSVKVALFPSLSDVDAGTGFSARILATGLPALTLALGVTASMLRMTRASLITILARPYIEYAHLKGLSEWRILIWHALPNALAPIINVTVLSLAYLITGVVVVEVVFVYPGLGQLMVDSVVKRDVPVVQACSLVFAFAYVLLNIAADVLSLMANPRLMHPR